MAMEEREHQTDDSEMTQSTRLMTGSTRVMTGSTRLMTRSNEHLQRKMKGVKGDVCV